MCRELRPIHDEDIKLKNYILCKFQKRNIIIIYFNDHD